MGSRARASILRDKKVSRKATNAELTFFLVGDNIGSICYSPHSRWPQQSIANLLYLLSTPICQAQLLPIRKLSFWPSHYNIKIQVLFPRTPHWGVNKLICTTCLEKTRCNYKATQAGNELSELNITYMLRIVNKA